MINVHTLRASLNARFARYFSGRFSASVNALRTAIAQRQIVPFYQPFMNASTGQIAGIEVLARWRHPLYGAVSPRCLYSAGGTA
ncbi:EAL domain-containing protein [Leclercia sp. S52]|uniref:EAL domain-containing protein n=1 Tax=Leclercia sp. S52 TaxID=3138178 RepID=UPI00321A4EBA